MVALIGRLRIANDMPLAIERASLSSEFLPDPTAVSSSLYAELGKKNARPVRAIQRISACNVKEPEAGQLAVPVGAAGLSIERIRTDEHTSEIQSLLSISIADFCMKKKK